MGPDDLRFSKDEPDQFCRINLYMADLDPSDQGKYSFKLCSNNNVIYTHGNDFIHSRRYEGAGRFKLISLKNEGENVFAIKSCRNGKYLSLHHSGGEDKLKASKNDIDVFCKFKFISAK
jgi:hypothetical protein